MDTKDKNIKEFFFVRHGETDHNYYKIYNDSDNVYLNDKGVQQANEVKSFIKNLNIRTVCCSPLNRALQTSSMIQEELNTQHVVISELQECSSNVWKQFALHQEKALDSFSEDASDFLSTVHKGLNNSLLHPGPILIVSHGGFFWALCELLKIETNRFIDNCGIAHFIEEDSNWKVRHLKNE